jgi:hypothetical protein
MPRLCSLQMILPGIRVRYARVAVSKKYNHLRPEGPKRAEYGSYARRRSEFIDLLLGSLVEKRTCADRGKGKRQHLR